MILIMLAAEINLMLQDSFAYQPVTQVKNETYNLAVISIKQWQKNKSDQYLKLTSDSIRLSYINHLQDSIVIKIVKDIIPYWYGTPWEFYGTTEKPKQGGIACGYFVTTILKHAGYNIEKNKLAQQASELIIKSLVSEKYIKRFSYTPIEKFVNSVKEMGEGLYIVGLDIHVGFIYVNNQDVYFIHSSYIEPRCVVKEIAVESKILASSEYRVIGKISADPDLTEKWLTGEKIKSKTQ